MTLNIDLAEDQVAALTAMAKAQGVSTEEFARQVLAHELEAGSSEPFWKAFTRRMHSLPGEVFDQLPTDGASEHDHYVYGSPKRNQQ
jgi:hypothetical protein